MFTKSVDVLVTQNNTTDLIDLDINQTQLSVLSATILANGIIPESEVFAHHAGDKQTLEFTPAKGTQVLLNPAQFPPLRYWKPDCRI